MNTEYNHCLYLANNGFYRLAEDRIHTVIAGSPKFVAAYVLSGLIKMHLLKFREALPYFRFAAIHHEAEEPYRKCLVMIYLGFLVKGVIIGILGGIVGAYLSC